jgi:tagaturonate reductase
MPDPIPATQSVIQFGTGRFLRGFVDAFLQELNVQDAAGAPRWSVTAVESSGSGAAARLRGQGCRYRLLVRGLDGGQVVDDGTQIEVIRRAIDASHDGEALLEAALDPTLVLVVSNTTEAGYQPQHLPARLSLMLEARVRASLPGVTILPCELIEHNGRRLRELVVADARRRDVPADVIDRMAHENVWAVTIVDRIVTSPANHDAAAGDDPFAVVVEPYASWVVEAAPSARIPVHPAIERTLELLPYALRKIRILNGAHTALVARTRDLPVALVREALEESAVASWLEEMLLEEVVPALGDRISDGTGFVRTTLERIRNPFQDHRLADIAVGHADKLRLRLLPTYHDYVARFGRPPRRLATLLESEGVLS